MTSLDETTAAGTTPAAPAAPIDKSGANRAWVWAQVLAAIADAVKKTAAAQLAGKRPDGSPVMTVGDRESSYLAGKRLGSAQMFAGKTTVTLDPDHPALVAWAKENPHYAHNVIQVEMLSPAVVDQLKKHAAKVGGPVDAHGDEIPGMSIGWGQPYLVKDLDEDLVADLLASERINRLVDAVVAGTIALPDLLALDDSEGGDV